MTSELATAGFEINTDASLIEPDWEIFAAEHDRRYGLAISYLKSRVQGDSYDNQVMELRVGRQGFYAQSRRFPAAFFGDTTAPTRSFIPASLAATWARTTPARELRSATPMAARPRALAAITNSSGWEAPRRKL